MERILGLGLKGCKVTLIVAIVFVFHSTKPNEYRTRV